MQINENECVFIKEQLQKYLPNMEFRVFGSRFQGTAKRYSDLDIALISQSPIPLQTLSQLEEIFAESDLPYKIDLVDVQRVSESFRSIIDKGYELL
jgi:hypothetical protein